jgi:hypothetical protein
MMNLAFLRSLEGHVDTPRRATRIESEGRERIPTAGRIGKIGRLWGDSAAIRRARGVGGTEPRGNPDGIAR